MNGMHARRRIGICPLVHMRAHLIPAIQAAIAWNLTFLHLFR